jgi:hypothetical protein
MIYLFNLDALEEKYDSMYSIMYKDFGYTILYSINSVVDDVAVIA